MNQFDGFDCPSCAWPDPDDRRAAAEFCENGVKAVASETTAKQITSQFFEKFTVSELSRKSDYWLEQQGRLVEPMVLREGAENYEGISWREAFALLGKELNQLNSPDEAVFYTSGRANNEAAFLYQLFVRQFGTNNLPGSSNMCHESSEAALKATIGVGKGTVSLTDFDHAEAIFLFGQNPGTNHPRMLSALRSSVRNGATIVAINPLKEAGLLKFAHPQEIGGLLGRTTSLASLYLRVRVSGDHALLKGLCKAVLEAEDESPSKVLDHAFIERFTTGFASFREKIQRLKWESLTAVSGVPKALIEKAAEVAIRSHSTISCWAMGLTQHKNAVPTIQEIVNFHLLLGNLGKQGAGLCPVQGHSNVQGNRTVGICGRMPRVFLDGLGGHFGFDPPAHDGFDTVSAIQAHYEGRAKVFVALGGNLLSAGPDTRYTAEALTRCRLTVQVSTKLNRSHLITGRTALILPCLGRTERDLQRSGPQFVTTENSMSVVQMSRGTLEPASDKLLSECAIVSQLARATLGDRSTVDWEWLLADYDRIRDAIEKVIPGFERYNERVRQPGGFRLPNPVRERDFSGIGGAAFFTVHPLNAVALRSDQLLLTTIRSHDQFNTTVYGLDDRYRGIRNERRVLFMNRDDMEKREIRAEQPVEIMSHFENETRIASSFLALPYDIPSGCVAGYFPELNVLVPIRNTAHISNTPASKSVVVTVRPLT